MACEKCGHSGCYSWHTCPICSKNIHEAPRNVQQHVDAGHNFVEGIFKIIAAFFLHPFFCLIGFGFIGFVGMMLLAPNVGIVDLDPGVNPGATVDKAWQTVPLWYRIVAIAVPGVLAVILRKYVRPLMKWIFYIGVTALIIWGVVAMAIHVKNR
ncbi:MAG: hypothetical protein K8I00_00430 [Candidatus Omnitrophica bacterium]|nr:hypothetical protein [Candidatus Omnitrophota bacterium]